jgi:rRNA maturation endonuclease Nob1
LVNRYGLEVLSDQHLDDDGKPKNIFVLVCSKCRRMILTYPKNVPRRRCPGCGGGRKSLPI